MMRILSVLFIVLLLVGCHQQQDTPPDAKSDQARTNQPNNEEHLYLLHVDWEKMAGNVDASKKVLQRLNTTTKRLCSKVYKAEDTLTLHVTPTKGYLWKHFTATGYDGTNYVGATKHGDYSSNSDTITIPAGHYYMFGVKPTSSNTVDWAALDVKSSFLAMKVSPSWKQEQGYISKGQLAWKSSSDRLRSGVYKIQSDVFRVTPKPGYEWKYWVAGYDKATGHFSKAKAGNIYTDKAGSIAIDKDKYYMFGVRKVGGGTIPNETHLTFAEDKWRWDIIRRAKQMVNMTYKSSGYVSVAGSNEHLVPTPTYNYVTNNDDLGTRSYGVLKPNTQYSGGPYSSVTWMNNIVGTDISFETFMTSLRNPNAFVNRRDLRNGTNRGGFYGTVCSGLVLYALGLDTSMTSHQMIVSDEFETLAQMKPEYVEIGDIFVNDGHVQVVTKIVRGVDGRVEQVIVTEAKKPFAKETTYTVDNTQTKDTSAHMYFHLHVATKPDGYDRSQHVYIIRRLKSRDELREFVPSAYVSTTDARKIVGRYNRLLALDKGNKANYIFRQGTGGVETVGVYLDSRHPGELRFKEDVELTLFGANPPSTLYLFRTGGDATVGPTTIDASKVEGGRIDPITGEETYILKLAPHLGDREPGLYTISPSNSKEDPDAVSFRIVDVGSISLGSDGTSFQIRDYDSSLKPVAYLVGYYSITEPTLIKKWEKKVSYFDGSVLKRTDSTTTHRLASNLFRTNYGAFEVGLTDDAKSKGYQWKYFELTKSSTGDYESANVSLSSYDTGTKNITFNPNRYYMFAVKKADGSSIDDSLTSFQFLKLSQKRARRHFVSQIFAAGEVREGRFALDMLKFAERFSKDRDVIVHVVYRNAFGRVANEKEFTFDASAKKFIEK